MHLADAVIAELDDRFYARKLLVDAENRLADEGFDFSRVRRLAAGIGCHLQDTDWARRLLTEAAARAQGFAGVVAVAEAAAGLLAEPAVAQTTVRELLDGWAAQLSARADAGVYDWSKLAAVRGEPRDDQAAAGADLDRAVAMASGAGPLTFAELAKVARELGAVERVPALLEQARAACTSAADARAGPTAVGRGLC